MASGINDGSMFTLRGLGALGIAVGIFGGLVGLSGAFSEQARGEGVDAQRLKVVELSLADGVIQGRELSARLGKLEERVDNLSRALTRELSQVHENVAEARRGIEQLLLRGDRR